MERIKQKLKALYGGGAETQLERYGLVRDRFIREFGSEPELFVSSPGRSELGGNHTDHQNGCVLTAAVDLDTIAAVRKENGKIEIRSEGYEPFFVDLSDLSYMPEEAGTSRAIVRGIAARMAQCGYGTGGFCAAITSDVLPGSGLSSSASFEVLTGAILNFLYNQGALPPVKIAQIGQYAENEYFKKPSGLEDQMACALGGVSYIDFLDPAQPVYEGVPFDLKNQGYALCIVNTGGCHDSLTDEYASITKEMGDIAGRLGQQRLRHCDPSEFLRRLPALRASCGDRAVLRALHFFAENERPKKMADALLAGDFIEFLNLVKASGHSSYEYLQNVSVSGRPQEQALGIGLALSERVLANRGAWRVHGGGFAGTIQAYVPIDLLDEYKNAMRKVFGAGSCFVLNFRYTGPVCINF